MAFLSDHQILHPGFLVLEHCRFFANILPVFLFNPFYINVAAHFSNIFPATRR
jgi:hypothetical protein